MASDAQQISIPEETADREQPASDPGFIKFYGLYWHKKHIDWSKRIFLGQPQGWMGKGKTIKGFDKSTVQMNFWNQKGVYILYDQNLNPVYAGQAGLTRKTTVDGQSIGDRIFQHSCGIYRNGWDLFSWFGFLETKKLKLKEAPEGDRMNPSWSFSTTGDSELNLLLASFEAILIEGFAPRFNARGGDLGKAVLVDQYEGSSGTI